MGSYVSIVNNTDQAVFVKFSPNGIIFEDALKFVLIDEDLRKAIIGAGDLVVGEAYNELRKALTGNDGYVELQPGGRHTSSKWSLSLLMQANVVKPRKDGSGIDFGRKSVWTAPTDGDTYTYNVTDCSWDFYGKDRWTNGVRARL